MSVSLNVCLPTLFWPTFREQRSAGTFSSGRCVDGRHEGGVAGSDGPMGETTLVDSDPHGGASIGGDQCMGGDSGQRSPQGSDSCGSVGPRRRRDLPSSAVAVLKDWLLSADQSDEPLSEEVRAESGVARGVDDWNCVFFFRVRTRPVPFLVALAVPRVRAFGRVPRNLDCGAADERGVSLRRCLVLCVCL